MPLSFRGFLKKITGANGGDRQGATTQGDSPRPVTPAERFRPANYPRLFVFSFVMLIGLCAFFALSRLMAPVPVGAPTPTLDYGGLATSALQTALAAQLSALQANTPTAQPSASPEATTTALPPGTAIPVNPWMASIPEAACIPTDIPQTGTVVGVINGATIRVLLDEDGRVYSVRYLGLEAPSAGAAQPFAERATARNIELTFRQHVMLVRDITDSDGSGVLLRYVMVQRTFVNYALIAGGFARAQSTAPDTACMGAFETAEQQARAASLGLWNAASTIIPVATSP